MSARAHLAWTDPAAAAALASLAVEDDPARWMDQALCAETDPEIFFPEKGAAVKAAKEICFACPVRQECLEYAIEHDEQFGLFGGLSANERRRLKRNQDARAELLAVGEKSCSRCGDTKPLDDFPAAAWGAGWASWCRECTNATRRKAAAA